MAYIHCHECNWEQDDFWSWGYNPIRSLWQDFKQLFRPRLVAMEQWFIEEVGLPSSDGTSVHSWRILRWKTGVKIRVIRGMKWWTWALWKRDSSPACPDCGNIGLCVD